MHKAAEITLKEQAVVRALQKDLPLVPEPYKAVAEELGMTEDELLEVINGLKEKGCLKRISIALRHNNVGYTINVMGVWYVDEEHVDEVGESLVSHKHVTHCYRRGMSEKFPYNLYTMLHARSEEECETIVKEIKDHIEKKVGHPVKYDLLRSLKELKKTGMKYFIERPEEVFYS